MDQDGVYRRTQNRRARFCAQEHLLGELAVGSA